MTFIGKVRAPAEPYQERVPFGVPEPRETQPTASEALRARRLSGDQSELAMSLLTSTDSGVNSCICCGSPQIYAMSDSNPTETAVISGVRQQPANRRLRPFGAGWGLRRFDRQARPRWARQRQALGLAYRHADRQDAPASGRFGQDLRLQAAAQHGARSCARSLFDDQVLGRIELFGRFQARGFCCR